MVLNKETFEYFAMKHYDNPRCVSLDEFRGDLSRIKYLKKLFRKYVEEQDLKERLILNHLIIFFNVFENNAACRLLFFSMPECYFSILKTFLIYLKRMDYDINPIGSRDINFREDINVDDELFERLEGI